MTANDPSSLLRVAIAQFAPAKHIGATQENLDKIADLTRQAAASGAQIVVFSELATSGYGIEVAAVEAAVEMQDKVLERLKAIADEYSVRVVASYPFRDIDGKTFIAVSVFSPDGSVELTYHKTHPWIGASFENQNFSLGSKFAPSISLHPVTSQHPKTENGKTIPVIQTTPGDFSDVWLNTLICWDVEFPEPARTIRLATPGTHHMSPLVLCVPSANPDALVPEFVVRARATENHCFILWANPAGEDYCGRSTIVGPNGEILGAVNGKGEELLVVDLDVGHERYETSRKMNPMLEWRRPELYEPIVAKDRLVKPSWPKDVRV